MDRRTFVMGKFEFDMTVLGGDMLVGCAAQKEPASATPEKFA